MDDLILIGADGARDFGATRFGRPLGARKVASKTDLSALEITPDEVAELAAPEEDSEGAAAGELYLM